MDIKKFIEVGKIVDDLFDRGGVIDIGRDTVRKGLRVHLYLENFLELAGDRKTFEKKHDKGHYPYERYFYADGVKFFALAVEKK